ncbi:MAG: acyl carrier protein [Rhodospirillaceae bacterium]|nr:acyl carrier protein [Rhodospirillaceae bacterium]|tara:strand:- start:5085 stop:5309 length:225 start_codon:yes stop_codon:yes gene_type:complete
MMNTVGAILHDVLKIPKAEISLDLSINSIQEWDSLAHLELMMYLEEAYSLVIDEDSIIECGSAAGLCEKLNLPL